MAHHDDLMTRRLSQRERFQNLLIEDVQCWCSGILSESALQGVLGYYESKWGNDATSRVVTAALNEWGALAAEARLGASKPAGEPVPGVGGPAPELPN